MFLSVLDTYLSPMPSFLLCIITTPQVLINFSTCFRMPGLQA